MEGGTDRGPPRAEASTSRSKTARLRSASQSGVWQSISLAPEQTTDSGVWQSLRWAPEQTTDNAPVPALGGSWAGKTGQTQEEIAVTVVTLVSESCGDCSNTRSVKPCAFRPVGMAGLGAGGAVHLAAVENLALHYAGGSQHCSPESPSGRLWPLKAVRKF